MDFVGRQVEIGILNDLDRRPGVQMLILYGRRRVGKTRLITHWTEQLTERRFYWMATQTSATNQLRQFSHSLFQFLNPGAEIAPSFSYASWDAALAEAARAARQERLILVLDEFTYVMQADPEVPSLVQKAWDHHLRESQVFLIMMGSLAGIIQRTALDYQSPLYGRATARLKLQPLPFGALVEMLPRFSAEQRVAAYAICGGIPAYLEMFDDALSIQENLQQRIVTPTNVMLNDAAFLLHEQLDEPRNYMAVIEAIAAGYHRLSDIARMSGISRSNITKYLAVLRELGYVRRLVPATIRKPQRSRKGRYVLTDAYLRFYFRFLNPHREAIEQGRVRQATTLLYDHLRDYIGRHTFEELSREWVRSAAEMGTFPFLPERVGSFWSRRAEVDVVAINWRSGEILLGECKWGDRPVDRDVLDALMEKADKVIPSGRSWRIQWALFARRAFTDEVRAAASKDHILLLTLEGMERDLQQWANRASLTPDA